MKGKQRSRRLVRWLTPLLALALAAAACGDDGDGGGGSAQSSTSRILRIGADLSAEGGADFDPAGSSPALIKRAYHEAIYDVMIRTGEDGSPEPGLATEWEVPDPLTLELTLREGVKFQDGTDFNAEAVKFSWDRVINQEGISPYPEILQIDSIEVLGPHSLRINMKSPVTGGLLKRLEDSTYLGVVSPTALEKVGEEEFRTAPVGAGPFVLESFSPDQRVELRAWDGYWDPDSRLVDGIDFIQAAVGPPALAALVAGEIDVAPLAVTDAEAARQQGLEVAVDYNGTVTNMHLCDTSAPFDNLALRKAVAYAIDREAINQAAFAGQAAPTSGLFAEDSPYYDEAEATRYTYDPGRAKQLREESGIEGDIDILVMFSNQPRFVAAAQVIQQNLAEIGINVEIRPSDGIIADLEQFKPDAWLSAPLPSRGDLLNAFVPDGIINWCDYADPEMPELLRATQDLTDGEDVVAETWGKIQKKINDEVPFTTFTMEPAAMAHSTEVEGVTSIFSALMGPLLRTIHFK